MLAGGAALRSALLVLLCVAVPAAGSALDAYKKEILDLLAGTTTTTAAPAPPPLEHCTAGRFRQAYANGYCENCPAGKFQRLVQAHECESCPWGKYQLRAGQNQCLDSDCAAGTVPTLAGCTECKAGQSAALGAAKCTSCDIAEGQYSFVAGGSACEQSECTMGWRQTRDGCVECLEGEFQSKVGQAWCLKCPTGFVSARGSSTCYRSGTTHADRVLAKHAPGVTKECSHITCQWNGHHVQVSHDGRERHGGSHHCYYVGAKFYTDDTAHGECVCMCKENDLGDSLYMLIPHGPGSAHAPHAVPILGQLTAEQIADLHHSGIALPPCVGDCKRQHPTHSFDPTYRGFNNAIAKRQREYLERGEDVLHWARTGV